MGSSHGQQTMQGACVSEPPSKIVDGGWIKESFDPWQRSLFVASVSSANTKEKGPLLAGKWLKSQSVTIQMKATRKTFLSSIRALKSSSVTV